MGEKPFFQKDFKKYINEDQKSILLKSIILFEIRNAVVSLYRNGFIKFLEYLSTAKLEQNLKPEQSVGERTKLRRQRFDEIVKKEKKVNLELFRYYFKYSSPSNMYKELNKTETEKNEVKIDFIENDIADLKKDIENVSKDGVEKIETLNRIKDIVELILDFNNEDQEGSGLRILTPSQMLSRLSITLAQLKAGNNSEKLKNEIGSYCILCTDQKNLQKTSIKV